MIRQSDLNFMLAYSLQGDITQAMKCMMDIKSELKNDDTLTGEQLATAIEYANEQKTISDKKGPKDREINGNLLDISHPSDIEEPILHKKVEEKLQDFLEERKATLSLLAEGIKPPNSILLYGEPGVGKTYSAKWLACKLNIPLATVNLATITSAYWGETEKNIKKIFDYANKKDIILFFDEMDSIFANRERLDGRNNDNYIRNKVNAILKELERDSFSYILIGATNCPEALDKAVWRRFDRSMEVPKPDNYQRLALIKRSLGKRYELFDEEFIEVLANLTKKESAAIICKICDKIKRKHIIHPELDIKLIAFRALCDQLEFKEDDDKAMIAKSIKKYTEDLSENHIADILGVEVTDIKKLFSIV